VIITLSFRRQHRRASKARVGTTGPRFAERYRRDDEGATGFFSDSNRWAPTASGIPAQGGEFSSEIPPAFAAPVEKKRRDDEVRRNVWRTAPKRRSPLLYH
jgi:hypothetical protein